MEISIIIFKSIIKLCRENNVIEGNCLKLSSSRTLKIDSLSNILITEKK